MTCNIINKFFPALICDECLTWGRYNAQAMQSLNHFKHPLKTGANGNTCVLISDFQIKANQPLRKSPPVLAYSLSLLAYYAYAWARAPL
jgi:hypothetical protein